MNEPMNKPTNRGKERANERMNEERKRKVVAAPCTDAGKIKYNSVEKGLKKQAVDVV